MVSFCFKHTVFVFGEQPKVLTIDETSHERVILLIFKHLEALAYKQLNMFTQWNKQSD